MLQQVHKFKFQDESKKIFILMLIVVFIFNFDAIIRDVVYGYKVLLASSSLYF